MFLTSRLFTIDTQENFVSVNFLHITIFYIEKKCDYHQNQVQNKTVPAEQTLVGMIFFVII